MCLDGMDAVAVSANGRKSVAPRDGLAMDALIESLRNLGVAFAAGGGDIEF
jgi:hypothetical protein